MLFSTVEEGQGLVEYALILALVVVVVVAILTVFGDGVLALWNNIVTSLLAAFS